MSLAHFEMHDQRTISNSSSTLFSTLSKVLNTSLSPTDDNNSVWKHESVYLCYESQLFHPVTELDTLDKACSFWILSVDFVCGFTILLHHLLYGRQGHLLGQSFLLRS